MSNEIRDWFQPLLPREWIETFKVSKHISVLEFCNIVCNELRHTLVRDYLNSFIDEDGNYCILSPTGEINLTFFVFFVELLNMKEFVKVEQCPEIPPHLGFYLVRVSPKARGLHKAHFLAICKEKFLNRDLRRHITEFI